MLTVSSRQPHTTFTEILDGVNGENCVILGRENPVCGKSAYQDERGPEIRIRIAFPYLNHRLAYRQGAVRTIAETAVKCLHKLRGAAIIHIPQRQKQAPGPGAKQTSHQ